MDVVARAAARALGGCFRGCSTFCRDNFKTTLAGSRRGVRRSEKRRYSGRGFGRGVVVRLAVVTQVALMADPQNILGCPLFIDSPRYRRSSKNIFSTTFDHEGDRGAN